MNFLKKVYSNLSLKEDVSLLENYLFYIFLYKHLSNKKLSAFLNIPIPIVVAIKKEFFKLKILEQNKGIALTNKGKIYVENIMGIKNINKNYMIKILENDYEFEVFFENEIKILNEIFSNKPKSDLSIDQTDCTPKTSLKRAVLALKYRSVINKNILCIGDDDLVSISLAILLSKLFFNTKNIKTTIKVIDIDNRMINFIEESIKKFNLFNIKVSQHDLIFPLPKDIVNIYDTVFTDPPYTLNGLKLFISRSRTALNNNKSGKLFLSFSEKNISFNFLAQNLFLDLKFIIENIYNSFNEYKGAGIIGGRSKMIILTSLETETNENLNKIFTEKIYTGEINKKIKYYKCKNCKSIFILGKNRKYNFIEELKQSGCPNCNNFIFQLLKTEII